MPILLQLTDAGLDAVVAAETGGTDAVHIVGVGLTNTPFVQAPTLIALPGEFKRVATAAGASVSPNIIHVTAYDTSADAYDVTGIGLFLADGTLLGTYTGPAPVLSKAALAFGLMAFDIAFSADISAQIDFGNPAFLYPPATEDWRGVARISTNAQADAGVDDATIMTPKKVKRVLDAFAAVMNAAWAAFQLEIDAAMTAFQNAVNASIAALQARTITGSGLADGGGNLTADRAINVAEASGAELQAAAVHKAASAWSFGQLPRVRGAARYEVFPGGTLVQSGKVGPYSDQGSGSITFPIAFADTDYDLQLTPAIPGAGDYDNYPQIIDGSKSTSGVSIFIQDPSTGGAGTVSVEWRAEGRI